MCDFIAELDDHRTAAEIHFTRRCQERYGLEVSEEDYQNILCAIKYSQRFNHIQAYFSADVREEIKLYTVMYHGVPMYVIYNMDLDRLMTTLSEDMKEVKGYVTGTSIF